jgi:hypothetical protein
MWKSRKATASTIDRRKNADGRVNRSFCRTQVKQPPHAALPHWRFDTLRGTKAMPLVFTADGFAVEIGPDDAASRVGAASRPVNPPRVSHTLCVIAVSRFAVSVSRCGKLEELEICQTVGMEPRCSLRRV